MPVAMTRVTRSGRRLGPPVKDPGRERLLHQKAAFARSELHAAISWGLICRPPHLPGSFSPFPPLPNSLKSNL